MSQQLTSPFALRPKNTNTTSANVSPGAKVATPTAKMRSEAATLPTAGDDIATLDLKEEPLAQLEGAPTAATATTSPDLKLSHVPTSAAKGEAMQVSEERANMENRLHSEEAVAPGAEGAVSPRRHPWLRRAIHVMCPEVIKKELASTSDAKIAQLELQLKDSKEHETHIKHLQEQLLSWRKKAEDAKAALERELGTKSAALATMEDRLQQEADAHTATKKEVGVFLETIAALELQAKQDKEGYETHIKRLQEQGAAEAETVNEKHAQKATEKELASMKDYIIGLLEEQREFLKKQLYDADKAKEDKEGHETHIKHLQEQLLSSRKKADDAKALERELGTKSVALAAMEDRLQQEADAHTVALELIAALEVQAKQDKEGYETHIKHLQEQAAAKAAAHHVKARKQMAALKDRLWHRAADALEKEEHEILQVLGKTNYALQNRKKE